MLTGDFTVTTTRDPERVRAYLTDFTHQADWRDDVIDSVLDSGQRGADGAVYRQQVHQGPGTATRRLHVTVRDRGDHVEWATLDDAPVTAAGRYELATDDGGTTTVHCTTDLTFHGAGHALRPVVSRTLRQRMDDYARALTAQLDRL
ncbi:MAG TPA: SRPBCC family protein [Segeticoccus sp.]|uniref:SRPBCC family protein n=1 Tax=Segeticoccus sp. TaxID=2706531 RepID=UPI002D7E40D9|nr:SRPBCC family protein [Segeticoccus sp.]HET8599503.1 SRPBCC family protein [Segeticoccus sp.]